MPERISILSVSSTYLLTENSGKSEGAKICSFSSASATVSTTLGPGLRAKGCSIGDGLPDGGICHVHGVEDGNIAPPLRGLGMGEVETEADEDGRNEKSGIKTSGRDIVVLHPPSSPSSFDEEVEDRPHSAPAEVDIDSCRRNPPSATQHEWSMDVFEDASGPFAS